MKFNEFVSIIDKNLKLPRPGFEAQKRMAPRLLDGNYTHDIEAPVGTRVNGVLVFVYPEDDRPHILFTVRTNHLPTHKGQISFPGGGLNNGEDVVSAALREAEEEVGLLRNDVKVVGQLSDLYIPVSNNVLSPVVAISEKKPVFEPNPEEVERVLVSPIDLFMDDKCKCEEVWKLHDREIIVPYWNMFDVPLWGATAMVLSEFLEVLSFGFDRLSPGSFEF